MAQAVAEYKGILAAAPAHAQALGRFAHNCTMLIQYSLDMKPSHTYNHSTSTRLVALSAGAGGKWVLEGLADAGVGLQAQVALAAMLATQRRLHDALHVLEGAARIPAPHPHGDDALRVRLNMARVLEDLGRREDAERVLRDAPPGNAYVHYMLGNLLREGDMQGAEAAFREAVSLDPALAVAHGNLGALLHKMGRHGDALAAYERALEVDPGIVHVRENLAKLRRLRSLPE